MATGNALSARLLCISERSSSGSSRPPCRQVSSLGSNCYAVRLPIVSSDSTISTILGIHHNCDVTAVRRVANTNEQSDDFTALPKIRAWRGNATSFAKGRRVVPMAMVSWVPESLSHNEMQFEDFRTEILDQVGEVGAESNKIRLPWSQFQPQQLSLFKRGRLRSGARTIVDQLVQSTQPIAQSLDLHRSQKGLSKGFKNADQAIGHVSAANAVNMDADTSNSGKNVECHVEAVSWRERHISASIRVEASQEQVWEVLTDYGRLAEFIPNLTRSEQIPCPHLGRTWLLQEGKQSAMYWQIEARVVLDLEEFPDAKDGRELRFSMVDGDFKRYVGRWYLRPDARPGTTILHYEVNVTPRLLFPAAFVEKIIKSDLPTNLRAIAARAEDCSNVSRVATVQKKEITSPRFFQKIERSSTKTREYITAGSAVETALKPVLTEPINLSGGSSALVELNERSGLINKDSSWGAIGSTCKVGKPCAVDEVHLRRFDDLLENGGVHRRVVATITVEAPAHSVWAVLTAYESLQEFIPNLAICKVMTRDKNKVRLLQEGCKCLLYMVLHARVVLDLWERPQYEILFQQVEGDFDSFQGKWTLEPLGAQHTLLKYLVDTKMHKDSLLAEALVEEVIYEDLPANLCAIRDRVELLGSNSLLDSRTEVIEKLENIKKQEFLVPKESFIIPDSPKDVGNEDDKYMVKNGRKPSPRIRKRPLVAGLQRDFNILQQELLKFIVEKGTEGVMPLRCELREAGRVDLEKAITRNGGFGPVASKLNLSLAYKERKPRGYWDNLQNVHKEILLFQKENGKDRTTMPTRQSLERAGRYDLARSLEKWGGLREVARVLGLKVKKRQKSRTAKADVVPALAPKDSDDRETDIKVPLKTVLPLKSRKWVTMRRSSTDSTD